MVLLSFRLEKKLSYTAKIQNEWLVRLFFEKTLCCAYWAFAAEKMVLLK
jgi:hypothetical protein